MCVAGSVRWPQLMATEPLAGVEHMVSLVGKTMVIVGFGAMGQENDLAPDVYVGNFTQLQWLAYLNTSLAGWTPAY